jgi:protein disulfide-isomerase
MLKLAVTALSCVACLMGCNRDRKPPMTPPPTGQLQAETVQMAQQTMEAPEQRDVVAKGAAKIRWVETYRQAVDESRRTGKPIVLYFTGSDWCHWCMKIDQELISSPAFVDKVQDKLIFVHVDFPQKQQLPEQRTKENERLRDQFKVEGFPQLVVVNAKGEILGTLGYRAVTPEAYADTLLALAQQGTAFSTSMEQFEPEKLTVEQLRELYQQAEMLQRSSDGARILAAGLEKASQDPFFLAQRYRTLLEAGQYGTAEASAAREQLLKSKPEQLQELSFFTAFLDFRALAQKSSDEPMAAVAPLSQFLQDFPTAESPYRWRIEMILGEYLAGIGHKAEGLSHLQTAHTQAPERAKTHIQKAISLLEEQTGPATS